MANDKVLVYHHRHSANPVSQVPEGLAVITQAKLEEVLKQSTYFPFLSPPYSATSNIQLADPSLQRTSVTIPKGSTHIELQERDLLTEAQKTQWAGMPNYEQNVAGVSLPLKVVLGNVAGVEGFGEMVVLSEKRS